MTYTPVEGNWDISVLAKNLADEEYFRDTFGSFSGVHAVQVATYGTPRTYGFDVSVRF